MPRRHQYEWSWVLAPFVILFILAVWGPACMTLGRLYAAQYGDSVYAFYLDSGHTFYGHVRGVGLGSVVLSDVYSFQTVTVGTTPTSNLTSQQLNPLTAPENRLVLNRAHVLFYEKLSDKAKVLTIMRGNVQ